jgi:hypothetical protein
VGWGGVGAKGVLRNTDYVATVLMQDGQRCHRCCALRNTHVAQVLGSSPERSPRYIMAYNC